MARVTFIGAGSLAFTRNLVRDILTFPRLEDSTLVLMDIEEERLEFARRAVQKIVDLGAYPAKVEVTMDRAEALKGADAVLCTILAGGYDIYRHDIEVPKKYGVDICVGDTRGPAGIFRALRTIPVMLDICRDIERLCPDAILLNYTNPMAMLCRAMQRKSSVRVTGLCHSVQGTARMLAGWIGAPMDEVTYVCAGVNHQAWYTEFRWNGQDAYPLIREAVKTRDEVYMEEIVRNEMFLHLGYYVTESSGHNSEYNWWFRKRPALIEKYCHPGTGWNPGYYGLLLQPRRQGDAWKQGAEEWLAKDDISLERGHEYAASIINAVMGGQAFEFNGNVPNTGIVPNLPEGACVEVPVVANRRGFNSIHVGPLPPQCAALNQVTIASEEMAVEAALIGDPTLAYQAIAYDPLTAAVLSLDEIKRMTAELFEVSAEHLPQFSSFEIKAGR